MYARHLSLTDFRSWPSAELALEPGPCVLVGSNGQGKTNIVEALGYLATLGSHRVPTDAPLVRQGAERAVVRCAVVAAGRELRVEVEPERLALVTTDPAITYPNGDVCQFVSLTFRCRYVSGEAALGDDETLEVAWRPADDPPADLDAVQRRRLATALADDSACVFDR